MFPFGVALVQLRLGPSAIIMIVAGKIIASTAESGGYCPSLG